MSCILMRKTQRDLIHTYKIGVTVNTEAKFGMRWLQVKACWQPPKAGRVGEQLLLQSLWKDFCLVNVLILAYD